jgi:glycosyltransferase involved in cell wall biosynthesis
MIELGMRYHIVFYCPDSHILSNWNVLNKTGVGGGITARIRIAHALAQTGHKVVMYINCPRNETIRGVEYRHYSQMRKIETDIFIVTSSGGAYDLGGLTSIPVQAKLKLLMVHGEVLPGNVPLENFDYIYILSNFIRDVAEKQWEVDPSRFFVVYHGVAEENFASLKIKRDPHKLVYFSHPSKGLDTAISIFRILRRTDPRYLLHIFGGNRLWGGQDETLLHEDGIIYHGLIGQKELAHHLQGMGFSLNLQSRPEPFGMVITESMRAGCIVLASPVGAFPEIIQNGYNGFLVSGDHTEPETWEYCASLISKLITNIEYSEYIRCNAIHTPMTLRTIAKAWEGHWSWHFNYPARQNLIDQNIKEACSLCNGEMLMLADGLHCIRCGHFQRGCND